MAQVPPTQPPTEGEKLGRQPDWSNYMVAAAVTFTADKELPVSYETADQACLDIFDVLSWYKAHREYDWPDFNKVGPEFNVHIRLRRQLVSDVSAALQKAGNVRIVKAEGQSTSQGNSTQEMRKRKSQAGDAGLAKRKRLCKLEDEADSDADQRPRKDNPNHFKIPKPKKRTRQSRVSGEGEEELNDGIEQPISDSDRGYSSESSGDEGNECLSDWFLAATMRVFMGYSGVSFEYLAEDNYHDPDYMGRAVYQYVEYGCMI